jgi:hypothetical protein
MEYNPFGKAGAGAPYRDGGGNIVAQRKAPEMMPPQMQQRGAYNSLLGGPSQQDLYQ